MSAHIQPMNRAGGTRRDIYHQNPVGMFVSIFQIAWTGQDNPQMRRFVFTDAASECLPAPNYGHVLGPHEGADDLLLRDALRYLVRLAFAILTRPE